VKNEHRRTVVDVRYNKMKWRVRLVTKRKRKQAMRIKGNSIDELATKLAKHSAKFTDFEIETPVNDPAYWKTLILKKVFEQTHREDTNPTLNF
jgi:hypothetical protein